jgi:hypothetical protein
VVGLCGEFSTAAGGEEEEGGYGMVRDVRWAGKLVITRETPGNLFSLIILIIKKIK